MGNRRLRWHRMAVLILVIALAMSVLYRLFGMLSLPFASMQAFSKAEEAVTIVLDAGHGGYDSGSVSAQGIMEKDVTLEITLLLGERLEEAGYRVVYTRSSDAVEWESDNSADLDARVEKALVEDADYFLSIHLNASSYGDGACGFESYVDPYDEEMITLASAIHRQLSALGYSVDRGWKDGEESGFYVLSQNPVPAILIELGFITDAEEIEYIVAHPQQLADAIAQGVMETIAL